MTTRPDPSSAEVVLARLLQPAERSEDYTDPNILEGEGVSAEFIAECQAVSRRFNQITENTFPRDQNGVTYKFFAGESRGYDLPDAINSINNPLGLLRPLVLTSPSNMTYYGIGSYASGPKNYARSASERGFKDSSLERSYLMGVQAYENLFTTILAATNEESFDQSAALLRPVVRQIEGLTGREPYGRETAAGWLMHACLAVLIHPSEHITPAGRLRALALLNIYSTDELAKGFMAGSGPNGPSFYGSGIAKFLPPRIPHTLCPPQLRHLTEHKDWEREPAIQSILEPLQHSDYRTTSNNIIAHPREAVQLALLCLRHYRGEVFGIELLRSLPTLPRPTLAAMFGPRATFYIDNKLSNKLSEQVAQGFGTQFDPTITFEGLTGAELSKLQPHEIASLLGAALVRLRRTEDIIAQLATSQAANATVREQARVNRDPDGYCAALGISPDILTNYDQASLDIILASAHRAMSRLWHPDHAEAGNDADRRQREAMQKQLNTARDMLLDPQFRARYGRSR